MRDEDKEVDNPDKMVRVPKFRFDCIEMVYDIRNQKWRRKDKRSDHTEPMCPDVFVPNKNISDAQQYGHWSI